MAGLSGATVRVLEGVSAFKYGGKTDLRAQAKLMQTLGESVCPRVLDLMSDAASLDREPGILMECLYENTVSPSDTIHEIYHLLDQKVWRHPPFKHIQAGWYDRCAAWCHEKAPWISQCGLMSLYRNGWLDTPSLTHGDPTVANAMRNAAGELRLVDPLPCRPYVPPLVEVDVGKLMQSAAGFETLGAPLDGPWPWDTLGPEFQAKCRFWAAVHCARILPYAKDMATREWAESRSRGYAASI